MRGPRGGFVLCKEEYREKLDAAVFPGVQGGPLMHVIAAKAVCFKEAMTPEFKVYQETIAANARALCDKMAEDGYRIVSGGTETHLFMIDLRGEGLSGREAQDLLESVGINVNMNEIPYDETPPTVTSGIRIGTPAVTTRGMKPEHMEVLGALISRALKNKGDPEVLDRVRAEARDFISGFPIYR
jgi:glycine hydroxymethyltransferase